jgi:proline iminopeptidase
VEQVRRALDLGPDNFYLLGQSWGGILAIEYALAHQDRLKGLVVSNMMASAPAYNAYARDVLMPNIDPTALAEIRRLDEAGAYTDPRFEELLMEHHYVHHVLRLPADQWPEPVVRGFAHINMDIYVRMQGPSELGLRGTLEDWDRTADLGRIVTPTLVIGAAHDTMDPEHMKWMAGALPDGRYLHCPDGSHLAMYDDQQTYMAGLVEFLRDVDAS